ncbi:MAG: DNA-binding domain-containing protein [Sphingomonas bacterium]|nr:DNA-binding domain-containing protein [Sphingomonas bacterium]
MSLLALQRDFQRHLVDAPGGIDTWIDAPAPGLAVYHNAYRAQLVECLAETYAQTHAWVGGEAFLAAMRAHIERSPPSGWTLGAYGGDFAETLAQRYPDDLEVAELATLEWVLSRAFEAEDAGAMPAAAIAGIDWDEAAIVFVPSLGAVPAMTNAGAIWSALVAGNPPPAAAMLPEPAMLLVWRQDFAPCFRTVEMIEHDAIVLAAAGTAFADLCTMLVEARGEAEGLSLAGQMLGQWLADGLIRSVTTKDIPCA